MYVVEAIKPEAPSSGGSVEQSNNRVAGALRNRYFYDKGDFMDDTVLDSYSEWIGKGKAKRGILIKTEINLQI